MFKLLTLNNYNDIKYPTLCKVDKRRDSVANSTSTWRIRNITLHLLRVAAVCQCILANR